MTLCQHRGRFFGERRARTLKKMANMRAAKERKRLANPAEEEPRMITWYPFEFGVRDKRTGQTDWHDLVSVRHAATALGLVLKFYDLPAAITA